jgi:hypothetical protein
MNNINLNNKKLMYSLLPLTIMGVCAIPVDIYKGLEGTDIGTMTHIAIAVYTLIPATAVALGAHYVHTEYSQAKKELLNNIRTAATGELPDDFIKNNPGAKRLMRRELRRASAGKNDFDYNEIGNCNRYITNLSEALAQHSR